MLSLRKKCSFNVSILWIATIWFSFFFFKRMIKKSKENCNPDDWTDYTMWNSCNPYRIVLEAEISSRGGNIHTRLITSRWQLNSLYNNATISTSTHRGLFLNIHRPMNTCASYEFQRSIVFSLSLSFSVYSFTLFLLFTLFLFFTLYLSLFLSFPISHIRSIHTCPVCLL